MTKNQAIKLKEIINELESLYEDITTDNPENYHLGISEYDNSILIRGNSEGLINLSISGLKLAASNKNEQHYHLGAGALDKLDKELELQYCINEWE